MDIIRFASHLLVNGRGDVVGFGRGDVIAFAHWFGVTVTGLRGRFMQSVYGQ